MERFKEWVQQRVTSAALSAASALVILQFVLPGLFDFLADLIILGLIWVVGYVKDNPPPKNYKEAAPRDWVR
jgi:hypothetical protein